MQLSLLIWDIMQTMEFSGKKTEQTSMPVQRKNLTKQADKLLVSLFDQHV
jgi:hypothetical protein